MFDRKNNHSGLTLIEVIIVIAILGVVMATIYSLSAYGLSSFSVSNKSANDQFDVLMATDFISNNVRYADQIQILNAVPTGSTPTGAHDIYLDNGEIYYKIGGTTSQIIGTTGISDYAMTFEKKAGTHNVLNFKIGKVGTTTPDISTDLIILNTSQTGIAGTSPGIGIRYYIDKAEAVTPVSITGLSSLSTISVEQNEVVNMPLRVTAIMSDSTTRQVAVKWSPSSIDTSNSGVKNSTGTVVGYNTSVTYTVIVGDFTVISVAPITDTAIEGQAYTPPGLISAMIDINSDGIGDDTVDIPVVWDGAIDTSSSGTETLDGTVEDLGTITDLLTVEVSESSPYITSINNINVTVNQGISFTPSSTIAATMSDGSVTNIDVSWTPSGPLNTSTAGTRYATTSVNGWGTVTLTLTVIQSKLPTPTATITQTSSGSGSNGKVKVYGTIGAIATLRKSDNTIISTGTIASNGEVEIINIKTGELNNVILTKTSWLPSEPYNF